MNSIVAKAVVITAIIALIVGFLGGYQWKNLNAAAPIAPVATTANSVSSDILARALATKLAPEMVKANGSTSVGSLPAMTTLASSITGFLIPTAQAQTTCGTGSAGVLDSAIKDALGNLFGNFDDGCREATITGKLTFSIWTDLHASPPTYAVDIKFNAHVTVKELARDCKTVNTVFDGDLKTEIGVIGITSDGKGGTIVSGGFDNPGSNYTLVCTGTFTLNKVIGSIDKAKCPYCVKSTGNINPGS